MSSIFQNPTTTVPKKDARIVRIDFQTSELGARRAHMPKNAGKNDYAIQHTKGG
jgi:hypothetical protein